jgi:hypothetical protein
MVSGNGYTHSGSFSYPDDINPTSNINMPLLPLSPTIITEGYNTNFMSNVTFEYPIHTPIFHHSPPNEQSPTRRKAKTEPSFSDSMNHSGQDAGLMRQNTQQLPIVQSGENALSLTSEFKDTSPKVRGRGRARRKESLDQGTSQTAKIGKGRGSTQGMVLQIPHLGREEALAEQALKRKRVDVEERQDDTQDHILQGMLTKANVEKGLSLRKRKADAKGAKREHHACDRCFRNKTKVSLLGHTLSIC